MANQDAAFGLRPLKTVGQQDDSTGMASYWIDAGDASVVYQGSPVIAAAGYIDIATAAAVPNMGAFWGCFYNDPTTLKPTFKNYYPGGVTPPAAADIEAFVYDSPMQMFEIQSNNAGASAQADVFSNADYAAGLGGGSTLNGVSSAELDDATIGAAGDAAAQLLILGVSRDPKNSDISAANVNWRVMINMHLLGHGVGTVGA